MGTETRQRDLMLLFFLQHWWGTKGVSGLWGGGPWLWKRSIPSISWTFEEICCYSWISTKPWSGGIPLTEYWLTLPQFSKTAMRKTTETTVLAVSLPCLVLLREKLFWQLLKSIWKAFQSLVTASLASWEESLLIKPEGFFMTS